MLKSVELNVVSGSKASPAPAAAGSREQGCQQTTAPLQEPQRESSQRLVGRRAGGRTCCGRERVIGGNALATPTAFVSTLARQACGQAERQSGGAPAAGKHLEGREEVAARPLGRPAARTGAPAAANTTLAGPRQPTHGQGDVAVGRERAEHSTPWYVHGDDAAGPCPH